MNYMFLNILKNDLRRKKTINLIILVFVVLSSMFFSSSMNNILSVLGGVDPFLDMAGMKDYFVLVSEPNDGTPFGDFTMGINTYDIQNTLSEVGGRLWFKYSIDINSDFVSENEMEILVTPSGEEEMKNE